jgi:hypothetical protein
MVVKLLLLLKCTLWINIIITQPQQRVLSLSLSLSLFHTMVFFSFCSLSLCVLWKVGEEGKGKGRRESLSLERTENKGVCSLAIYFKKVKYIKAKEEELWKLQYFTSPK